MELLFVTVIGAGIGLLLRYVVPGRHTYGILVLPALAAAVTALVWVALVWLGWTFDGTWIWVVSLLAGGIAALVTALVLRRARPRADERLMQQLSGRTA